LNDFNVFRSNCNLLPFFFYNGGASNFSVH
jgi:hypothetical protein